MMRYDLTKHVGTAWIIEAAWARSQPAYLGVSTCGGQFFEWTFDPHRALKFADRGSCDALVMTLRKMRPELFPGVVPMPTYTEHLFSESGSERVDR